MFKRLKQFFYPGDFPTLIILTVLMVITPLSLKAGEWPLSMGVIIPITTISVFFGLLFSRSQFGELMALIISSTYGVCLVLLFTAIDTGGGLGNGVYEIFNRVITWSNDAITGGINTDDTVFTLLVAFLFWFLGYNAAWHSFRIDRIWRVILPPGMILATNTVFYAGDANIEYFLVIFLFLSLMLVVRSTLDMREWEWYNQGIRMPRKLRRQFLYVGSVLALLTLLAGWIIPSRSLNEQEERFQEFLQSPSLQDLTEFWSRLFSPIDALGPTTADYYGGDSLELGGSIRLGDQTVFWVDVDPTRRYYWRSRAFDTYEGGTWRAAADTRLTDNLAPFDIEVEQTAAREAVQQEFTVALNATRILYTAPQPLQIDLTTRTDLSYTSDPTRSMNISVIRPTRVIRRGETYTATSLMSVATADQLRSASTRYPDWVRQLYFYVPGSITPRTRDLAQQIVDEAGAITPYDKAKAIEAYLRQNITYNETIPTPPTNQDQIDWFLFDLQQGYCNYYASAMIMMLRSQGIPARMAAGFAQGTWSAEENGYVVTERDAHTWVEVYFPGYGWIEFEPTAAQAPLNRDGDDIPPEQNVPPNQPTPTPTFTSTPDATSTPNASETPPSEDNNGALPPTSTPTITPTFTPTPTATPVIVPTQPAPIQPDSANPLDVILPALSILAIGLILLLVLIAIGTYIWWWLEWRGMRGLSPVTRAYARLERYLGIIGIRFGTDETTEERRRRMIQDVPQARRPISAITRMYTTERYGRRRDNANVEQRKTDAADQAWSDARSSLIKRWMRRFMFWRDD